MFSPKIGSKMNLHISPVHTPDKCDIIFHFKHTMFFKEHPKYPPRLPPGRNQPLWAVKWWEQPIQHLTQDWNPPRQDPPLWYQSNLPLTRLAGFSWKNTVSSEFWYLVSPCNIRGGFVFWIFQIGCMKPEIWGQAQVSGCCTHCYQLVWVHPWYLLDNHANFHKGLNFI